MKDKRYWIYTLMYILLIVGNMFLFGQLNLRFQKMESVGILLTMIFIINILVNSLFFKATVIHECMKNKKLLTLYILCVASILLSCIFNFPFSLKTVFLSNLLPNFLNIIFFLQMNLCILIYVKFQKDK